MIVQAGAVAHQLSDRDAAGIIAIGAQQSVDRGGQERRYGCIQIEPVLFPEPQQRRRGECLGVARDPERRVHGKAATGIGVGEAVRCPERALAGRCHIDGHRPIRPRNRGFETIPVRSRHLGCAWNGQPERYRGHQRRHPAPHCAVLAAPDS